VKHGNFLARERDKKSTTLATDSTREVIKSEARWVTGLEGAQQQVYQRRFWRRENDRLVFS
jgi:hypothetical protein